MMVMDKVSGVSWRKKRRIPELLEYLREEGDVMPWEKEKQ